MDTFASWTVALDLEHPAPGIASFREFLAGAGVKYEPTPKVGEMIEALRKSKGSARFDPREMAVQHLVREATAELTRLGDARRLFRDGARWLLLTPEELEKARAGGLVLEASGAPLRRAMWGLASVPVALGVYLLAGRVARAQGIDENVGWIAALVAWFVTRQLLNRFIASR